MIEYAGRGQYLSWGLRTLRPAAFWRWMHIAWPVRSNPLTSWWLALAGLTGLSVAGIIALCVALGEWLSWTPALVGWRQVTDAWLRAWAPLSMIFWPPLIVLLVLPLLRGTMARYRLRTDQMSRVAVYSSAVLALTPLVLLVRLPLHHLLDGRDYGGYRWQYTMSFGGPNWPSWLPRFFVPTDGYLPYTAWSDGLRLATVAAVAALAVAWWLRRRIRRFPAGKLLLALPVVAFSLCWPGLSLLALWSYSLSHGLSTYLRLEGGRRAALLLTALAVLATLFFDAIMGGWMLYDIARFIPLF